MASIRAGAVDHLLHTLTAARGAVDGLADLAAPLAALEQQLRAHSDQPEVQTVAAILTGRRAPTPIRTLAAVRAGHTPIGDT